MTDQAAIELVVQEAPASAPVEDGATAAAAGVEAQDSAQAGASGDVETGERAPAEGQAAQGDGEGAAQGAGGAADGAASGASSAPTTPKSLAPSSPSGNLMDRARDAFVAGDVEASMRVHDLKAVHGSGEEVWHGGLGADRVRSITLGGLDGIITTFAIVAAVVGGGLPVEVVLMMGCANLLADGISMGMGDFLSSKAEHDFVHAERRREAWEFEHNPDGERREMVDLYKAKGFAEEDAEAIIAIYTKKPEYAQAFIDHMMIEELGQQVPGEDDSPLFDGIATFFSFLIFGSVPIIIYAITYGAGYTSVGGQFGICCAATVVTMFLLGAVQAIITRQNPWMSGLLMMINGALAAAAAYLVGWGLEEALGVKAAIAQSFVPQF